MLVHFVQSCWYQQAHVNIIICIYSVCWCDLWPTRFSIMVIYDLHLPCCLDSTLKLRHKGLFHLMVFCPIVYVESLYSCTDTWNNRNLLITGCCIFEHKSNKSAEVETPALCTPTNFLQELWNWYTLKEKINLDLPECEILSWSNMAQGKWLKF